MVEILIAGAIVSVLLAANGGESVVCLLYATGAAAIVIGLVLGVPAGIVYHVKLFRELSALGAVEPGWWWRPTSHHDRLPEQARRLTMPWFGAGAAGFLLAVGGCALILAALLAQ
jgi:hypothetical protein